MMNKRRVALLLLVLLISVGLGAWLLRKSSGHGGALVLYGNVDIRKVDLAFRVSGRVADVLFEEGDLVKPGQVVAYLDDTPYRDEVSLAAARQSQAAAQWEKMKAGSRPQEIAQAEALVAERQATLHNLQLEYRRSKNLVGSGAISKQAFDNATARLQEGQARLATAQQGLRLARDGFRAEDVAAAHANFEAAEASLASARTRLADTEIKAPAAGTILTRVEEPGAIVQAGQTVAILSLVDPVWVRAYVEEPDLGRIRPGMTAEVFTDTDPGKPYRGHVGFISPEAEFTPKAVQTEELRTRLVFQLRIIVDNPDQRLRQGMPVTVRLRETEPQPVKPGDA
ncbi:MAG: secretion protein HlyD [Pedobacter sp.]